MGENDLTEWDDLKNDQNIDRRGIDFAGLQAAFDGRFALVVEDKRQDYGERRFNMLVELYGVILHITSLGARPESGSFRPGSRAERKGGCTMPISKAAKPVHDRTDWAALRTLSEDELERAASEDEDNPATDESHWAEAAVYAPPGKTAIHATFDQDVVEFFKRGGQGYSTRMNTVLRRYMEAQQAKKADR